MTRRSGHRRRPKKHAKRVAPNGNTAMERKSSRLIKEIMLAHKRASIDLGKPEDQAIGLAICLGLAATFAVQSKQMTKEEFVEFAAVVFGNQVENTEHANQAFLDLGSADAATIAALGE